jgi:hypothetical protein
MAASNTRKPAKKATRAARSTGRAAEVAGRETGRTAEEAQRTAATVVRDGAYALVGVGDQAVEMLRHASQRAEKFRSDLPRTVEAIRPRARVLAEEGPGELRSAVAGLVSSAEEGFDAYARRGRDLLTSVRSGRPTRRAAEQVRTARSQVKAARTSVGKAVDETVDAAQAAADKVGA